MGEAENQANYILPPVQAAILTVSTTTGSVATAIPSFLRGRYVTIEADGTDIYFAFGLVGTTIDQTIAGSGTGNVCVKLPADQPRHFKVTGALDLTITHFIFKASAGTPMARIYASSPAQTNAANSAS